VRTAGAEAGAPLALAIPYYSGLDYLGEALASARAQRDPDWTLTVVDDSPEKCGARERVESLGDARVRYLANPGTLGMVPCWNRCLEVAGGELVTLLHADDRLLPDYVGTMKRLAAEHPGAVALFCAAETIDAGGERRLSLQDDIKRLLVPRGRGDVVLAGEPGLRALMRGNFVVCPTLCWRRARLGERRFDPTWRQVQDLDLLARLLFAGETLAGSRAAHYSYRRHAANATARQTESLLRFEEEFALFERIASTAAQHGWRSAARVSRRKSILRLHLAWRAVSSLATLQPGAAGRYLRFLFSR
jgi:glycosyltransferase involved in cell wall biosynthesis